MKSERWENRPEGGESMQVLELDIPPFPQIAAIGHGVWKRGMKHASRVFEAHDLIFCASGALYIEEEGERYEIGEGEMLVLEANRRHAGYRPSENDTEVYWIHFRHEGAGQRESEALSPGQPLSPRTSQETEPSPGTVAIPKFGPVDLPALRPLLHDMLRLYEKLTLARSYELNVAFGRLLLELQKGLAVSPARSRADRLGEEAAAYLERGLQLPFDSARMERDLHYHFDYLSRCLKQHTGMSPLAYRHHLQIERAKRLLIHSDDTLAEIGEQCGFQGANYFARLFKRETAMTPGAYRKKYRVFLT
ncbi:AraC family transcriptional regulator [Saccharibacillus alkalitolerans]|uniref:AraC family transcriptional regulator n=1 Tax=Saccharibacillus alkalitolerans TaxID=2705290 RepID=A0ABX0F1T2_9BACL|nr:AraC family transcriptional regulator [Saccharibacillus alkalitolerans]NGZ74450.1 AraC family transcriptional regulator [Saccharibacillus alkalitolerans]